MSEDVKVNRDDNKFRPQAHIDDALQHELDEALGDMSIEQLIEAEEKAPRSGGARVEGSKDIRKGRVIAIQGEDIFVDMGGKSQGVLSASSYGEDTPMPEVGGLVEVIITGFNSADGMLILSRQGAVMSAAWETLAEGQVVEGRVTGHNKGGLELTINGIRAFMPISQIELFRVEDLSPYVNQKFQVKVTEVDRAEQNVIVSRRDLLEVLAAELKKQAFETLAEGKIVMGKVKTIMPYGAFVDIGGVDGLLHVKDMSHARVEDPHSIVKEGQQLEVKILKIDKETRKIALGLKQVMPDPWVGADVKWPAGSVVTGRVARLAEFGAFVTLEEGVDGLVPISELTFERRIKHPDEIVKVGDVVRIRVMNVDLEKKRISLSLKRAGDDPWMGASSRWPVESVVTGVVKRLAEFGAFIEIAPGVEGLAHISELSNERVRSVSEVLKEGQTVKASVLEVDEERRRISLSIKKLTAMSDYTGETSSEPATAGAPEEPPPPPRIRKKPLKGGLE